jgi:hypothetical protein
LHSTFYQIKGYNCCVCDATTKNTTQSTEGIIFSVTEFTTVLIWKIEIKMTVSKSSE